MNVSIVIPCLNEEANIEACLNSLVTQDYAPEKYEVIVVDGGSRDRTQNRVRNIQEQYPNVRLLQGPQKTTSVGRNTGIKASRFDYVALIDADCEAPPGWLKTLVKNYQTAKKQDDQVIAVGGANIPPHGTHDFVKAIGIALDAYLGSFNSVQGRQFQEPVDVPSLATVNALYEKEKIREIGYFDESLGAEAEDADLNYRLRLGHYKLRFVPDSVVWHKMRSTPAKWLKNMFRYGKGRARLLKRYPEMWEVSFMMPILFFISMLAIFLAPISFIFLLPMLYFPVILIYAGIQCLKKKSWHLLGHVTLVYFIQHFGYAVGEVYGLINPKIK